MESINGQSKNSSRESKTFPAKNEAMNFSNPELEKVLTQHAHRHRFPSLRLSIELKNKEADDRERKFLTEAGLEENENIGES